MIMYQGAFKGILGIVTVLGLMGVVMGLALSGSDSLNFSVAEAAARASDQETQVLTQRAEIDLSYYRAIQEARTQAEIERMRIEREAQQRELEYALARQRAQADQDLALAAITRYTMLAVGAIAALAMSAGLAVFFIEFGRSQLLFAQAQAAQAELWRNPIWRSELLRQVSPDQAKHEARSTWQSARGTAQLAKTPIAAISSGVLSGGDGALSGGDNDLLRVLNRAGAATPMELEIKTGRIGDDLQAELRRLLERGLVEAHTTPGGYENEIYSVSPKGRKAIH